MLKIKDDAELKKLEKYGFKLGLYDYKREAKDGNKIIISNDRQIYMMLISKPNKLPFPFAIRKENVVRAYILDLINNDIVEKVEE